MLAMKRLPVPIQTIIFCGLIPLIVSVAMYSGQLSILYGLAPLAGLVAIVWALHQNVNLLLISLLLGGCGVITGGGAYIVDDEIAEMRSTPVSAEIPKSGPFIVRVDNMIIQSNYKAREYWERAIYAAPLVPEGWTREIPVTLFVCADEYEADWWRSPKLEIKNRS